MSRFLAPALLLTMAVNFLVPGLAQAQTKRVAKPAPKPASNATMTDALARAKKSGRPLLVFGVSEGCSRCAALKQGIEQQPELNQLVTQYESLDVRFGGPDFVAFFENATGQEPKYRQAVGAPSVFLFTSAGKVVYAGPNTPEGMTPGDQFKTLLATGIEKNTPVRTPSSRPAK